MNIVKKKLVNILLSDSFGHLLEILFRGPIPCWRFGNLHFDCSAPEISLFSKAAIFWGLYESRELRFVNKYVMNNYDLVELGSSIGVITCHAAKLAKLKKVIAVEAFPGSQKIIEKNLLLNSISNVKIISKAIGSNHENLYLKLGVNNTEGSIVETFDSNSSTVKVESTTLSSILEENHITNYGLLCDIEGSEIKILLEDTNSLKNCQLIIIEFHDVIYKGIKYDTNFMKNHIISLGFWEIETHGVNSVFSREPKSK